MPDQSDLSETSSDAFTSDLSRRDSDIQYQPRGFEESSLVYNLILLHLAQLNIPGPLELDECISDMNFLGAGALFEVFGLKATVQADFPPFDGPKPEVRTPDLDTARSPEVQKLVAIKRIKIIETCDAYSSCISLTTRNNNEADVNHLNLLQTEVRTISEHHHPNIVKLLAWGFETSPNPEVNSIKRSFFLVLEHALGSAEKVLKEVDFPWIMKSQFSAGVTAGLKALHEFGTIHGDIKPENVLIFGTTATEYGLVSKIADFNLAWSGSQISYIPRGTYGWAAPELEDYNINTLDLYQRLRAADTWSLALTVWSMLFEHGSPIPLSSVDQYARRLEKEIHVLDLHSFEQERLFKALGRMLEPDALKRAVELDALRMALATPKEYSMCVNTYRYLCNC
jgi:serine/threonine protein kinase